MESPFKNDYIRKSSVVILAWADLFKIKSMEKNIVFKKMCKLKHLFTKEVVDAAELIADGFYDDYLNMAVNNDMSKISFVIQNFKYYVNPKTDNDIFLNQHIELGLLFAHGRIRSKSKHGMLFRYKRKKDDYYKYELSASNRPITMTWIGECYIYEIY